MVGASPNSRSHETLWLLAFPRFSLPHRVLNEQQRDCPMTRCRKRERWKDKFKRLLRISSILWINKGVQLPNFTTDCLLSNRFLGYYVWNKIATLRHEIRIDHMTLWSSSLILSFCFSSRLKVLGKSVGLCKTTKRKDQLSIQFTCFCMENHLWKFQPKRTHISWDMNENINKENKKEFWFCRRVTVMLSNHYHR